MYQKVTQADLEFLKSAVPGHVYTGEEINEDYTHDEMGDVHRMPGAVVRPVSEQEVSAVMAYASEHKIPVTVRGAGTGLSGGAVPLEGTILMDLTLMNHILELDEDTLTVTVEAGVLLKDLSDFVESKGFFYPPDPGERYATLGGNISTNAGGMRAVKYGTTREYVKVLTVVLPTGEIVDLGANVSKNSTGYALKELIPGSEGTLAVVTKAKLKLLPLPTYSVSLLVPFPDMDTALSTVSKIIRAKYLPTAIEYMGRDVIGMLERYLDHKFISGATGDFLLMTFDGFRQEAVDEELEAVAELCVEAGALDAYLLDTKERSESVWDARHQTLEALKFDTTELDECDVVVPRSKVADFIRYTDEVGRKIGVRICNIGHAGDGNVHVNIFRDDLPYEEWKTKFQAVLDELFPEADRMGGLISGEHGVGWSKRKEFTALTGPTRIRLMKGIKAVFDPANILNPDKIFYDATLD